MVAGLTVNQVQKLGRFDPSYSHQSKLTFWFCVEISK